MVWGNYFALIGAAIFILFGLVLLVDFAHSWTEKCLENYEESESNKWKYILIGKKKQNDADKCKKLIITRFFS